MKISFIIPAYNEELVIAKCLESVQKELARTPCDAEVVVVNNASHDRTKEIALTFKGVRVVDEPKKGLVFARAAGFAASSGELVANIDSDVMVPEGWLKKVFAEFEKDPHLVALSGPYIYYDLRVWERALVKMWYFPGWLFDVIMQPVLGHALMLQGGNFILRRGAWVAAGGFDTKIAFYGEDADVARRISKQGKVLWTWSLPMYTSGRRLRQEGVLATGYTYAINLLAIHITGKPYSQKYTDIRPK